MHKNKKNMDHMDQYLVSDPTWSAIFVLSGPMLLNMLALAAANLFEGWIAGRLGAHVQSAVGLGSQIWFLVMMLTLALSAGTISLLSRCYGAMDRHRTVDGARQSIILSVVFGSLISTTSVLLAQPGLIMPFCGSAQVAEETVRYLQLTGASALPYTVLWILNSIFRAKGDSITPLVTMVAVTLLMIGLEALLCINPLQLGVSGIGLSWLAASTFGVAMNVYQLKRSDLASCLDFAGPSSLRISMFWLKQFMGVGLPACMQDIAIVVSSFGVFYTLGHCPSSDAAQAAWAAGWRLEETLVIMPMYGLNMAAATIVGQNIGAGLHKRAKLCGWQLAGIAAIINIAMATVLFFQANNIANFMSVDPTVKDECISYITTICWTEPFFACWLILSGCMVGAGRTGHPMIATILAFDVVRIGLAWYFCAQQNMGAQGVWIAMAVSTVCAAVSLIAMWQRWREGESSAGFARSATTTATRRQQSLPFPSGQCHRDVFATPVHSLKMEQKR